MKVHPGKISNKYRQFNKNSILQASVGVDTVYILPSGLLLEYISENLFLGGYVLVSIIFIGLLFIILLTGREDRDKAVFYETDRMNHLIAKVRNNPDKYDITKTLCQQYIDNHAKRGNLLYNEFPADKPNCHMNSSQIEKFASIWDSLPWTCGAHTWYTVQGGLVCNVQTGIPVQSNSYIVGFVARKEESGGRLPKLNALEIAIRDLDYKDGINRKR